MKRKILWLVVSGLMVLALLAASCAPKVEEEVAPLEEKPPAVLPTLSIGETAKGAGVVEVTVLAANFTDSYQYYSQVSKEIVYKEASPGMSFLLITAKVKNVGTITQKSGSGYFYVVDSEGHEYHLLPHYGEDAMVSDLFLISGAESKGKALFQIPKGASGLKIKYTNVAEWEVK